MHSNWSLTEGNQPVFRVILYFSISLSRSCSLYSFGLAVCLFVWRTDSREKKNRSDIPIGHSPIEREREKKRTTEREILMVFKKLNGCFWTGSGVYVHYMYIVKLLLRHQHQFHILFIDQYDYIEQTCSSYTLECECECGCVPLKAGHGRI